MQIASLYPLRWCKTMFSPFLKWANKNDERKAHDNRYHWQPSQHRQPVAAPRVENGKPNEGDIKPILHICAQHTTEYAICIHRKITCKLFSLYLKYEISDFICAEMATNIYIPFINYRNEYLAHKLERGRWCACVCVCCVHKQRRKPSGRKWLLPL